METQHQRGGSESQDTAVLRQRQQARLERGLGGSRMQDSRGKEPGESLTLQSHGQWCLDGFSNSVGGLERVINSYTEN